MSAAGYNPQIHHRRSIRLKGHDYAGGGLYFVTICAHRSAGDIFAPPEAQKMVSRIWKNMPEFPVGASLVGAPLPASLVGAHPEKEGTHKGCREKEGTHKGCPYVIMPDHFHALVRMSGGSVHLGEVIGAFKSLVVREYIAGVKAGRYAPFQGKIWHRNYYEMIVRTPEAERNIREYIRINPWKLVQHAIQEGQSFRMIGNPALLNREKIGMLCSRNCPPVKLNAARQRAADAGPETCFISGFHSPPEKSILDALLKSRAMLICCPAWGIDTMRIPSEWIPALEANRMLILEMRDRSGDLAAAEQRNRFVLNCAEKQWLPHVSRGGMLERLVVDRTEFQDNRKD